MESRLIELEAKARGIGLRQDNKAGEGSGDMLKTTLIWASILTGLIAAGLWFGSTVVKVNYEEYEVKLRAEGHPWLPAVGIEDVDGSNVLETLKLQSKWNRWAAGATALSVLLQAIAAMLPD